MDIQIIGAGFPRTGTMTLKKALEILGFDQTYHFKDLIAEPNKLKHWLELETKGTTNFEQLFDGYSATVDFPGYPYYKTLLQKYPGAKVILTLRDFESWYESTYATIWKAGPQTPQAKAELQQQMQSNPNLKATFDCIKFMRSTHLEKKFDGQFASKAHAKKVFLQHIKEVTDFVPKENLLIYNVSEGWTPLCKFLSIPFPEQPFPHLNKKENFHQMVKKMIEQSASGSHHQSVTV